MIVSVVFPDLDIIKLLRFFFALLFVNAFKLSTNINFFLIFFFKKS